MLVIGAVVGLAAELGAQFSSLHGTPAGQHEQQKKGQS
jgi:hypothetical protein